METRLVELIYTQDRRGRGVEGDPIRLVSQLWTLDGELVAEHDCAKPQIGLETSRSWWSGTVE